MNGSGGVSGGNGFWAWDQNTDPRILNLLQYMNSGADPNASLMYGGSSPGSSSYGSAGGSAGLGSGTNANSPANPAPNGGTPNTGIASQGVDASQLFNLFQQFQKLSPSGNNGSIP